MKRRVFSRSRSTDGNIKKIAIRTKSASNATLKIEEDEGREKLHNLNKNEEVNKAVGNDNISEVVKENKDQETQIVREEIEKENSNIKLSNLNSLNDNVDEEKK